MENYELKLPSRFDDFPTKEILNMKVQVVHKIEGQLVTQEIGNIDAAAAILDLNKFCGPMYGEIEGKACLRFESQAAYEVLSN